MANTNYIKCPRCDLNFIQKRDKLCPVCKQEMQALSTNYADEGSNMGMCPICKVNYITDEENVCNTCMVESDLSEEEIDALYGGISIEGDPEDDNLDDEDEELEIIALDGEEEEVEEDEEEKGADPLDDFDESLEDDNLDEDDLDEDEL